MTAFREKCDYYLRRAEEQMLQAKQMMKRARDVRDRADQLNKTPVFRVEA